MGTSVASALTAETIFVIMKCMSDVDMRGRGRMGSKSENFRFFNSGYAPAVAQQWTVQRVQRTGAHELEGPTRAEVII